MGGYLRKEGVFLLGRVSNWQASDSMCAVGCHRVAINRKQDYNDRAPEKIS